MHVTRLRRGGGVMCMRPAFARPPKTEAASCALRARVWRAPSAARDGECVSFLMSLPWAGRGQSGVDDSSCALPQGRASPPVVGSSGDARGWSVTFCAGYRTKGRAVRWRRCTAYAAAPRTGVTRKRQAHAQLLGHCDRARTIAEAGFTVRPGIPQMPTIARRACEEPFAWPERARRRASTYVRMGGGRRRGGRTKRRRAGCMGRVCAPLQ
ncbi:hypothetical protein BC628DRAFT_1102689 [Trametes gibbosa]|nr:hypothetical protein BC628DRAFT_1102689 [Trametes gibbosa]